MPDEVLVELHPVVQHLPALVEYPNGFVDIGRGQQKQYLPASLERAPYPFEQPSIIKWDLMRAKLDHAAVLLEGTLDRMDIKGSLVAHIARNPIFLPGLLGHRSIVAQLSIILGGSPAQVQERPAELGGQQLADRALPGTRRANQDD